MRLGAALTGVLSIGGGFGAVVKTYHLVHAHEVEIQAQKKQNERLEKQIRSLADGLQLLCAEHWGNRECYGAKGRLGRGIDDE